MPGRAHDTELTLASLPQAALIFRLSGDWNPLHSDPEVAVKAGFERPILHGLGSYGMAAHAVLREACDYDAARLERMALRFKSPVYPGDHVRFRFWRVTDRSLHLRPRVEQRNVTVLDNGWFELV